MHSPLTLLFFLFWGLNLFSQQLTFHSLDSLLAYAERQSFQLQNGEQQALLARWQKATALVNTVNFKNHANFSLTDNTKLPVNFIPAEIFGGPAGSFREIQFGQQYTGSASFSPQIDLINLSGWEKVRSASLSKELTGITNLLVKKSLFESIAAAYFNILSLKEQQKLTSENLLKSDTLLKMAQHKYSLGLIGLRDVNDALSNKLNLEEKINQLKFTLEQQQLALKILCDFPASSEIVLSETLNENYSFSENLTGNSDLLLKSSVLQLGLAESDIRYHRFSQLPALSFFLNYAWQHNSNNRFFDSNSKWIYSQYIGARLSMQIPDVNKIFSTKYAKINYQVARNNVEHSKIQEESSNRQLQLDYQKAFSQFNASRQIYELKAENYRMEFNRFSLDILPFDRLLPAFTDMQNNRISYASAKANLYYQKARIDLAGRIR